MYIFLVPVVFLLILLHYIIYAVEILSVTNKVADNRIKHHIPYIARIECGIRAVSLFEGSRTRVGCTRLVRLDRKSVV